MTAPDGPPGPKPETQLLPRIPSGTTGVDAILGGGFPANTVNIIMGAPGTGKTIFAQQLAVYNADPERPVLYLTTVSEPLAKVITYLQQLSFYDETKVGSGVRYQDLGGALLEHGITALMTVLRDAVKHVSPSIIIIDSFKAIHDLATSTQEMRRFVADLAGLLTAYDTTTFLVGEYTEDQVALFPEFAVADGIIEFARSKRAATDERYLRVSKLRGASYREGVHGFRISAAGLHCYPRLVSPRFPRDYTLSTQRIPSGIADLDPMLGGGLWRGSCSLVAGPTGSGKTTAALQFCLQGVREGEPVLYLNFQENPSQLGRLVQALGGDVDVRAAGEWNATYLSPVELQIDSVIGQLFGIIQEADIRRVAIDGVGDLLLAAGDTQRVHDYLYALTQHLAWKEVSTLLTYETRMGIRARGDALTDQLHFSAITDNVILLDLEAGERLRRTLCVLKSRNTDHDLAIRELEITATGLRIG